MRIATDPFYPDLPTQHVMFQRTPPDMVLLLKARCEGISAVREKRMTELMGLLSDKCVDKVGSEAAIQLLDVVKTASIHDFYDEDAARALNLADLIVFEDTLIRETKLTEEMFANELDSGRAMNIPFGLLHFAMESHHELSCTDVLGGCTGKRFRVQEMVPATLGPHGTVVPQRPAMARVAQMGMAGLGGGFGGGAEYGVEARTLDGLLD